MNPDCPGTTDSELMLDAIAAAVEDERSDGRGLESALFATLPKFEGAFSLVVMDQGRIIGVRDPHGFRPLCLGRLAGDGWVLASETAALDLVGASYVREVEPGEMVVIDATGIRSLRPFQTCEPRLCLFEFVYFARPDSLLYGQSVQASPAADGAAAGRGGAGGSRRRWCRFPSRASRRRRASPPTAGSRIPTGLVKNRYIGRTFIEPSQLQRDRGIKLKLNPIPATLAGKRVVLVDDSIVRGSTTRQLVAMTREAGAAEVHLRISSPPYRWPCFYGMDTSDRSQLLAARMSVERDRRLPRMRQPRLPLARGPAGRNRGRPRPGSAPPASAVNTPPRWTSKRANSSWSKPPPDGLLPDGRRRPRRSRPPCRRDSRTWSPPPGVPTWSAVSAGSPAASSFLPVTKTRC